MDNIHENKNESQDQVSDAKLSDSSFDAIKEKASTNLSQLLNDLQAFEEAVRKENIPEIYRLYNGHLNEELRKSSNGNHEIDQLLMRNLHDSFTNFFPFMELTEQLSPTISYYRIGSYYHERATVGIDASIPEIFVLPEIDQQWASYAQQPVQGYSKQINEIDAKVITAKSEIERLEDEINEVNTKIQSLSETKGFLNRKKMDEEIDELTKKRESLESEKADWLPYIDQPEKIENQKNALRAEERTARLNRAVIEKEQRLIKRYFGGIDEFAKSIQLFLKEYLKETDMSEGAV